MKGCFSIERIKECRKIYILLFIVLTINLMVSGCSSQRVEYVGRKKRTKIMGETILTGNNLSYKTRQYLGVNALLGEYENDPKRVIQMLSDEVRHPENDVVLQSQGIRFPVFVLMELCVNQARKADSKEEALKYWMSACYYSYKYIFDKDITPRLDNYYAKLGLYSALHFYNISLSEVLDSLIHRDDIWNQKPEFESVEGKIEFAKVKSDLIWDPHVFKKFINDLDFLPTGFIAHSFDTGIGVPLIGVRDEESSFQKDKEMTLLNKSYPCVFVLKFDDFKPENGVITAQPELYGAFKNEFVKINDMEVPLYKDYSIFIGKTLDSKKYIKGINYMFNPGEMGKLQELYFISPYDPNKIPVILVHGLMSEPRTWGEALNLLLSNRKIRKNYQFLLYSYPTGLPAILSAARFREDLLKFKKKYDPDNKNPQMQYSVIIGHSMGGLLSSYVVQDSKGNYLVNKYLDDDIDKVDLTESQKDLLKSIFVFEAIPFIKRVVFIGVPHRGAEMATFFFSKIGSWMISIPASLTHEAVGIMKGLKKSQRTQDIKKFDIPTGIEDLAPNKGVKKYTIGLPYGKGIHLYSIIGDKDEAGKIGGTDGVVAYHSSHLDNVEREVVIKSGHDEIKKAECVKEMQRILLENLKDFKIHYPDKKTTDKTK